MRTLLFCSGLLAAACFGAAVAAPVSSAFTYQGELYDTGQPLNGEVDLRFTPYADQSNPTLLGQPVVVENVLVSEGIFTARVDFGPGFFVGDQVWLEIAARPFDAVDDNAFQVLTPRQEITAAPYSLKPAPGSVTDLELADDAVGATQLNDNAVASAEILDGSVGTADLAPGVFNAFWRLGGNVGTGNAALGTTDPGGVLPLLAPSGVTINGSRLNNNTELTVRGNPNTVETNADITLWPRGGEAFFNIASIPNPSSSISTELNTFLVISAVDTTPFSGFDQRAIMSWDGSLGLGTATLAAPEAKLHVRRAGVGFDTANDSVETQELVLEDNDAQLGLYSSNGGEGGSVLTLGEMASSALVNSWGIYRATSGFGSTLRFSFGTNPVTAANPVLFHFGPQPTLGIGAAPPADTNELHIVGNNAAADPGADLSLQPAGGNHLFDLGAKGTDETNTSIGFYFAGPTANYEPRLRVTGTGSFGAGKVFDLAHGGAFVFADDSSATPVATTAANQFVVRATGGVNLTGATAISGDTAVTGEVSIHSAPLQSDYELSVTGGSATDPAQLALRAQGSATGYVMSVDGTDSSDSHFRLQRRTANPFPVFSTRLHIAPNGFLGVNDGSGDPAHPLVVGTTASNGNGAHVTAGGMWTNGSSRTFKEAFSAVDAGAILDRVLELSITRWRYRDGEQAWHLGPVAEDFHAAFGLGAEEKYIGTVDADGVALAAIQGLAARSQARADALARENDELREQLGALLQRVEALERGD